MERVTTFLCWSKRKHLLVHYQSCPGSTAFSCSPLFLSIEEEVTSVNHVFRTKHKKHSGDKTECFSLGCRVSIATEHPGLTGSIM